MTRVMLMCSQGASTSMLVSEMQKAAKSSDYECQIQASSVSQFDMFKEKEDIILLGPQVGFMQKELQAKTSCKVITIPAQTYGLMDGAGALELVKKELGE